MQLPRIEHDHPLLPIVNEWIKKIDSGLEQKEERFQKYADEAKKFYDSDHNWMWDKSYAQGSGGFLDKEAAAMLPKFRMSVNRVFEMVALYGPALYHTNPSIAVNPILRPELPPQALGIDPNLLAMLQQPQAMPMDPALLMNPQFQQQMAMAQQYMAMAQQEVALAEQQKACALVKAHYLNWLQTEADKKTQARRAISEALQTGMSFLWTELYNPPGSAIKHPLSRYVSSDDVVFDPDADYYEDLHWVARKIVQPTWEAERKFQLPAGTLKGTLQSLKSQDTEASKSRRDKKSKVDGKSFDLIVYWEVYSKCGFGDRLKDIDSEVAGTFEEFGDYCYLAVSREIPYPLNMPSEVVKQATMMAEQALTPEETDAQQQAMFMRAQWPIPFWTDGGWPFARLEFYSKSRDVYPVSLVKPAISYLRYINWGMSFLADKAAASSDTIIGVVKSAAKELQEGLSKQQGAFKIIEISELAGAKSINDLVSFLQSPAFDLSLFNMMEKVSEWFDKATGLTDLMYGMSDTQMRSAQEANVKQANTSIRPEDMASRVEDWLSECAMKEIELAVWACEPQDVQPVLGPMGTIFWQQYVMTQEFDKVVRDFDYRVEAGSARKPNKNNRVRQLNEFAQVAMPTIQAFALQGQVGPWNALVSDMAKAQDFQAQSYLLAPPPPMPPPGQENQEQGAPANASPQ